MSMMNMMQTILGKEKNNKVQNNRLSVNARHIGLKASSWFILA